MKRGGHKSWREVKSEWFRDTPESRKLLEKARRDLDAKWQIECRYGNCVIFVSPDSSVGPDQDDGWGPVDCPCRANDAEMVVFRAGVLSGSLATLELIQARKHLP